MCHHFDVKIVPCCAFLERLLLHAADDDVRTLVTLQRHLIYSLATPMLGGVVTSPFWLTLMLSNHHWASIRCFLGGMSHPGQRVRDRSLAARVMTLLRVKLGHRIYFLLQKLSALEKTLPSMALSPPLPPLS